MMTTTIPAPSPSWASSTGACLAQAYGNSPAALISRRRDPLLVEARRMAMALLADCGRGPCWMGTALHRAHRTVLPHLAVLREHRAAQEQEMLSDLRVSIRTVPSPGRPGQGHERSLSLIVGAGAPGCMTMQHNG